jgi:hypothetical protein
VLEEVSLEEFWRISLYPAVESISGKIISTEVYMTSIQKAKG